MRRTWLFGVLPLLALSGTFAMAEDKAKEKPQKKDSATAAKEEKRKNYYKKWVDEDVTYLVTDEERKVFSNLTTDAEKDQFIEQFWIRRDPDPRTPYNEFKEEYYRRLTYVNDHFSSGIPGWKTDRGRIYLKWGPPSHIEDYTYGDGYDRPTWEGGGKTKVFPTQFWEYRNLEGVGADVELEFVDTVGGNLYTLQTDPNQKDILLKTDTQGKTLAEQYEDAWRIDRVTNRHVNGDAVGQWFGEREKDRPFTKYETIANVNKPPEIKYKDLKSLVSTDIHYDMFPFEVRADYIKVSDRQVLVPVTLRVSNSDITFKDEKFGFKQGVVNFYGMVSTMGGRFVQEFEDDISREVKAEELPKTAKEVSRFQKFLLLGAGKYKLTMVVKDINSGKVGMLEIKLDVPAFQKDTLCGSSIIFTDQVTRVADPKNDVSQFVLGDMKVVPDFDRRYRPGDSMWVYMQVYNFAVDQTRLEPQVDVEYVVERDGTSYFTYQDLEGATYHFISGDRLVIAGRIPIKRFETGHYLLRLKVRDQITGNTLEKTDSFEIAS